MRRMLCVAIAALFVCSVPGSAFAADEDKDNGRYVIYVLTVETKPVPMLLDTRTGKVWWYSQEQGSPGFPGGEKSRFKGITVDGLAYNQKDIGEFEKQIDALHAMGFVNKELKGFKESMAGVFSYNVDLDKVQSINDRLLLLQPKKE